LTSATVDVNGDRVLSLAPRVSIALPTEAVEATVHDAVSIGSVAGLVMVGVVGMIDEITCCMCSAGVNLVVVSSIDALTKIKRCLCEDSGVHQLEAEHGRKRRKKLHLFATRTSVSCTSGGVK
jgi:hypothetical protein